MNDRILHALTDAGLSPSPLGTLDHASAFFALYEQTLVYQEAGKLSEVALRDVTRIHSDREGVLRVETGGGTAVTASLLGYDPGRVQAFFQQVRDVTARAKDLPVVPLGKLGAPKSVNLSPGASPAPAQATPAQAIPPQDSHAATAPSASPDARQDAQAPAEAAPTPGEQSPASPTLPTPTAPTPTPPAPTASTPVAAAQTPPSLAKPGGPPTGSSVTLPPGSVTVVTPVSAAAGGAVGGAAVPGTVSGGTVAGGTGAGGTAPLRPTPTRPFTPQGPPIFPASPTPRPEPLIISSAPPLSEPPSPAEPASRPRNPRAAPTATEAPVRAELPAAFTAVSSAALRGRAESVLAFAGTVRLLAVVLGVAALALAFFELRGGGTLAAIWTLLSGGVGTVALLAFGEALRLLAALGNSLSGGQGTGERG